MATHCNCESAAISKLGLSEYYTGDMTYYQLGLGACGFDDTGKDMVSNIVALDHRIWDYVSNATNVGLNQPVNSLCNRIITISGNGYTTKATVRDRCGGCSLNGVDVSQVTFENIWGSTMAGRATVEWWLD